MKPFREEKDGTDEGKERRRKKGGCVTYFRRGRIEAEMGT
jgi:hypothetical protein